MEFRILYDRVLFLIYHHFELKERGKFKTWNKTKKNNKFFVCDAVFILFWISRSWGSSFINQKGGNSKINFFFFSTQSYITLVKIMHSIGIFMLTYQGLLKKWSVNIKAWVTTHARPSNVGLKESGTSSLGVFTLAI